VSFPSPTTGAVTNKKKVASRDERSGDDPLEVELEHSRWRHFAWAAVFGLFAAFLLFRVGGFVAGALGLVAAGLLARSGYSFGLTYLRPAGRILLRGTELQLPPRLHAPAQLTLPLGDVKHAYLLRRAVGWTTPGPLLVVETARGRFEYPRDWFSSETDQRRVASVVSKRLGHIA
jgi:hypothetical protein